MGTNWEPQPFLFYSIRNLLISLTCIASGVDIKNKGGNLTAPTPQNTPINPAPITSSYRPSIPAISEDMETINTTGNLLLFSINIII